MFPVFTGNTQFAYIYIYIYIYVYIYMPCSVSKEKTLKKLWKGKTQSRRDYSQHSMCFLKSCIQNI